MRKPATYEAHATTVEGVYDLSQFITVLGQDTIDTDRADEETVNYDFSRIAALMNLTIQGTLTTHALSKAKAVCRTLRESVQT